MEKRRLAIIGCGNMGRVHARDVQGFAPFDVVAASDPAETARGEMQAVIPSARVYADTDEMLAKEAPELVIVATAASAHAALSIAALRAGAHVLCEKPLAVSLAEADRMIATGREVGRMILVNHQFRINPRTQAALAAVVGGEIGEMRSMFCTAKGRFGGWELVESGTHMFDTAALFAGRPDWVSAHILLGERLATGDDIIDSRKVGELATGKIMGDRVFASVGFGRGTVLRAEFFDAKATNFLRITGTKGLIHLPIGGASARPMVYPKPFFNPNDEAGWREIAVDWGEWNQQHNLYAYDLWEKWLRGGDDLAVGGLQPMDAEFGRQSLEIIHGAFTSHMRDGARVLPLAARGHPLEG